jgi:hypothetical protein
MIIKTEINKSQVVKYLDIRNQIKDLILRYSFEFNTEKVRNQIANDISLLLDKEVVDKTTEQIIYNNNYYFVVKVDNNEYPLSKYLLHYERLKKIKKLQKYE